MAPSVKGSRWRTAGPPQEAFRNEHFGIRKILGVVVRGPLEDIEIRLSGESVEPTRVSSKT